MVQWLGLGVFTAGAQVWFLVLELRPCKLRGEAEKKKSNIYRVPTMCWVLFSMFCVY